MPSKRLPHIITFYFLLLFTHARAENNIPPDESSDSAFPSSIATPSSASANDAVKSKLLPFYNDDWTIYGNGTAIYQGYPRFHADHTGPQSLPSTPLRNNLEVADLFLGRRLWDGSAIYIDPQAYRGFGLNSTLGLAGFFDGEANKGGTEYVTPELARVYLQQIIGLGGPTEMLERGPNQLHEVVDVSRLTATAGKFSYTDFFDGNTYSHDPETQFLNWSFMDSLAWDWAQDSKGNMVSH